MAVKSYPAKKKMLKSRPHHAQIILEGIFDDSARANSQIRSGISHFNKSSVAYVSTISCQTGLRLTRCLRTAAPSNGCLRHCSRTTTEYPSFSNLRIFSSFQAYKRVVAQNHCSTNIVLNSIQIWQRGQFWVAFNKLWLDSKCEVPG